MSLVIMVKPNSQVTKKKTIKLLIQYHIILNILISLQYFTILLKIRKYVNEHLMNKIYKRRNCVNNEHFKNKNIVVKSD